MNRYILTGLAGAALLAVSACSNDNNNTPPGTGGFRVVNGISDSSNLSASATSGFPSTAGVDFDIASSIVDPPEGGYNVQLFNNGSSSSFYTVNNTSIQHNNITTIYTNGSIDSSTGSGFAVIENLTAPSSTSQFTFQFVNDTTQSTTSTLDIYLVSVGAGISGAQPTATAGAGTASTASPETGASYEIIVTNGTTTLFDSGASGITLPTTDANVMQIGALDATSAQASSYGNSPITLIITDNNGGETIHYNGKG
jgi:hypothetical protein